MNPTNSIASLTPEAVTTQFNAWYAVLMLIGGVVWHVLLKIWPSIKAVYPWVVANRGIGPIFWRFFYVPKDPPTEPQPIKPTIKPMEGIGNP